ncbi:hypothetical protein ANCCEY_09996 [Ancylostoma ceylanicum]|uniref:Mitoferrin-1 domain protein n=1 Tax=Ancylostoma ceylanicum TaxID=53326 RepID=A0A0D6LLN5_9BILA|nr:hypothetical protein ANCCEY_09996 [Ancylostoma ceylanicum]
MAAFYRSYTTQLVMAIPFQSVHFMTYEFWQQVLNPEHKYDPKSHLVAGGMAGGLAAAVTTPLDCIKTVLNTQQTPDVCEKGSILLKMQFSVDSVDKMWFQSTGGYRGIMDAVRIIYQQRGLGGFTCGLQARVIFQVPATALSWSVYELFKYVLGFSSTKST